jgi:hypothetical protein
LTHCLSTSDNELSEELFVLRGWMGLRKSANGVLWKSRDRGSKSLTYNDAHYP